MAINLNQPINTILTGLDARMAALENATPTPTPTPTPTALPQQSSIVARFDANTIPAQSSGTALASWASAAGSDVATAPNSGAQPTYQTGGQGSRPFVKFNGSQFLNLTASSASAGAMQSGVNTVVWWIRNVQASQFGRIWNGRNANDGPVLMANGTLAGGGLNNLTQLTYPATSWTCLAVTRDAAGNIRGFVNGTLTPTFGNGAPSSTDFPSIGGAGFYGVGIICEAYEGVIYNRELTLPELMQCVKYGCDKSSVAYPWAGIAQFRLFDSDSNYCNYDEGAGGTVTSGADNTIPARVAAKKGWPIGTYSSVAIVGKTMTQMTSAAPTTVDPIVGLLGSVPLHLFAMEYTNQASLAPQTAINNSQAYITARKSAGIAKLFFGTSFDLSDSASGYTPASRATYDANNWSAAGADVVVPFRQNAIVGADNACPNSSPYGPNWSGQIHLADPGYDAAATIIASAMS